LFLDGAEREGKTAAIPKSAKRWEANLVERKVQTQTNSHQEKTTQEKNWEGTLGRWKRRT